MEMGDKPLAMPLRVMVKAGILFHRSGKFLGKFNSSHIICWRVSQTHSGTHVEGIVNNVEDGFTVHRKGAGGQVFLQRGLNKGEKWPEV